MKVVRYEAAQHRESWDDFLASSRNGVFLFQRDYMDYHAERFEDCSLLLLDDQDRLRGLLPANRQGSTLHSHAGLTYGGLVLAGDCGQAEVLAMFEAVLVHLPLLLLDEWRYKCVPAIYHAQPSEDDRYALFRLGAERYRCDPSSCLSPKDLMLSGRRKRGLGKARRAALEVREFHDWPAFWSILRENLASRHDAAPVHDETEIALLAARFPRSVRLFGCFDGTRLVAGTVIYDSGHVAHAQYIASTAQGREQGALDTLFATLIGSTFAERPWFDFGISTEDQGRHLNEGLIAFKEGFGAHTIVHEFFCLKRG
ncbi:GNAT family N-acetyltransferase [Pseudomonas sp. Pseusp97]|uniref:GNAT family N-acetyltransferase n=1 Tax=Pseudomonas sp. Pseusp97 TaxID=3243065 RepID=UPI0039A56725